MAASVAPPDHIDYKALQKKLQAAQNDPELFKEIVNAPFDYRLATAFLFLGIIVLLMVDKKTGTINRIALSDTELAKNTQQVSTVPFEKIKIPLGHEGNIIASAIDTQEPKDTIDWRFLFDPILTPQQSRINQASAGIAYSAVHPLKARNRGALIFSYYQYQGDIGKDQTDFMKRYTGIVDKTLSALPAFDGAIQG